MIHWTTIFWILIFGVMIVRLAYVLFKRKTGLDLLSPLEMIIWPVLIILLALVYGGIYWW